MKEATMPMNTQNQMEKTGIQSIDKFFRYGQSNDKFEKYPFNKLIHTVIDMFQSEYTSQLHDRKANAIIKFCKERPHGFFYQQIQGLTEIFRFAKEDLWNGVTQMIPALQAILAVNTIDSNNMFNKNYGSDQLRYIQFLPAFLDSLEPFLRYEQSLPQSQGMETLKYSIINYLKRFAQRQIPQILNKQESFQNQKNQTVQKSPMQILIIQGTKHLRAFCESKVLSALMDLLYDYQRQMPIVFSMMELFSYMMMYSRLGYELCQKGILHLIMELILLCEDFRSVTIKTAFQIFWSAIEGIGAQVLISLATKQYIFALHKMFKRVIKEGYKLQDKCLRNQILILVNYLLSLPESIQFFLMHEQVDNHRQNSFMETLFYFSSVDEAKLSQFKSNIGERKFQFGTNAQDLQLKKLFWNGLLTAIQSGSDEVIMLGQEAQFIKYLLVYIDNANSSYSVTRWSPPQLRQLQQHVLSVLANIILHMKDDFEEKKGIFCLTKFLSNVTDIQRRQKCLKAFSNASLFQESYKIKIAQQGVIDYLIQFLQGDQNPIEIKELCFTILANLCQGCKKNKKIFRQKHGVDIIIGYLKDQNIATSNRYVLLGLALLNCLWNAVLGSRRSEQRFLNSQGLFDLLQFIQVCEYSHRKMSLSCLSYLTQNSKANTQFLDWNSQKTMVNATQLLIRLYMEQDERYGVKYEQGIILNRSKPLVPSQKTKTVTDTYLKDLTQAGTQTYLVNRIKEEVEQYDIRLIIFSILYRVGFNKNQLTAYQRQKMEVIQMYPHFKMGQVWAQIKKQLRAEGVTPTEEDGHWMETSIQEFEQQMSNCINTQSLIMKQFQRIQEGELNKFYQVIKYNKQLK